MREHRLYQADWLMRFYGFSAPELETDKAGNLDLSVDPKLSWALAHREHFPVDINTAPKEMLLRIPGIGVKSVNAILRARRYRRLRMEDLARLRPAFGQAERLRLGGRPSGGCWPGQREAAATGGAAPGTGRSVRMTRSIVLAHEVDWGGWRNAARRLALENVPPEEVVWSVEAPSDLFASQAEEAAAPAPAGTFQRAPSPGRSCANRNSAWRTRPVRPCSTS